MILINKYGGWVGNHYFFGRNVPLGKFKWIFNNDLIKYDYSKLSSWKFIRGKVYWSNKSASQ